MCIICEMKKMIGLGAEDDDAVAASLFERIMHSIDTDMARAGSAAVVKEHNLNIDADGAYALFGSGMASGVRASATLVARQIDKHEAAISGVRAFLRILDGASLNDKQTTAVDALRRVLAVMARSEVNATLAVMAARAMDAGIPASVAEGREGIDSMIDEQFVAIAQRTLSTADAGLKKLAQIAMGDGSDRAKIKYGRMMVEVHVSKYALMQREGAAYVAGESEDFVESVRSLGL